jgi:hypothetical protein
VREGEAIALATEHGELRTTAHLDERIAAGSVTAPHGFVEMNAARLIGSEPGAVDPVTGMPYTTGLPVTVRPA